MNKKKFEKASEIVFENFLFIYCNDKERRRKMFKQRKERNISVNVSMSLMAIARVNIGDSPNGKLNL